jgi:hypothetical protein
MNIGASILIGQAIEDLRREGIQTALRKAIATARPPSPNVSSSAAAPANAEAEPRTACNGSSGLVGAGGVPKPKDQYE